MVYNSPFLGYPIRVLKSRQAHHFTQDKLRLKKILKKSLDFMTVKKELRAKSSFKIYTISHMLSQMLLNNNKRDKKNLRLP